jgi:hypothetical protein
MFSIFLICLTGMADIRLPVKHLSAAKMEVHFGSGAKLMRHWRERLVKDIRDRQARGSNVYYSVNAPVSSERRQGAHGKNNIDDIIAVRALAFDIDIIKRPFDNGLLLSFIDKTLTSALRPSLLISTGGGYHLIYLLDKPLNVELFRPASNEEQRAKNQEITNLRQRVTQLAHDFEFNLRLMVPTELNDYIKIDNMSNVDRVMRLPGTVNYPKLEKKNKGQVEALAVIFKDYQCRANLRALRDATPGIDNVKASPRGPFIKRTNPKWPPYKMAMYCCEQIKDAGLPDSNETYTLWVMLPLIGMIHDENDLTIEEALECFLEAVCGGDRYGSPGRGAAYFMRQWKSHRPEIRRQGTRSLGSLIRFCQENGIAIPWIHTVETYDQAKHDPDWNKPCRWATEADMDRKYGFDKAKSVIWVRPPDYKWESVLWQRKTCLGQIQRKMIMWSNFDDISHRRQMI